MQKDQEMITSDYKKKKKHKQKIRVKRNFQQPQICTNNNKTKQKTTKKKKNKKKTKKPQYIRVQRREKAYLLVSPGLCCLY